MRKSKGIRTNVPLDIVHGAISTLIKPIILGVFKKKFYGGILKKIAEPILNGGDKWLTSIVGSMERRFVTTSPSKGKAIASSDDHQHDRKHRQEAMATENLYLSSSLSFSLLSCK